MPRSGAEARTRLREAALELYGSRGYEATTSAEIAARAGVSERTYFRHFADKREVLFDGEAELRTTMVDAIATADPTLTPLQLVVGAYVAAVPLFVAGRDIAVRRAAIIATSPALQERAHAKSAALAEAVVDALTTRGIDEPTARLAAQTGTAVFEHAYRAWDGTASGDLGALLERAASELRGLVGSDHLRPDDDPGEAAGPGGNAVQ